MRLAILSNVTISVLAGMLAKEHAVWTPSGFDTWLQTALEPPRELVDFAPEVVYVLLDARFAPLSASAEQVGQAIASLRARLPGVPVIAPDLARLAADWGDAFHDERMWKLGAMPFSLKGLQALRNLTGLKKVLALDLDNTLWKGVVGEDGVAGIEPDVRFQREIKALKDRGTLLVALSRNNAADVEDVWDDPRMALKREDFVAFGVDWNEKSDNLAKIAADLKLGTDAFVFVDDNPAERARMRAARPEVAVPEFPPPLADYFPPRAVTAEDLAKTELYRAEAQRKALAASGLSVYDYLKTLEIWAEVHPARPEEFARIAQLSQKSNQFNVLTHRYSEDEVARFASDPARILLAVHAGDRFGDQGLIAFAQILFPGATTVCPESNNQAVKQSSNPELLDFVMSCRAMNRHLEFAVQDSLERVLAMRGEMFLRAAWRRTERNAPVRDLFDRLGYSLLDASEDARAYELNLLNVPLRHYAVHVKGELG